MHLVIDLEVLALNGALSSNAHLHDPTFCHDTHSDHFPLNGLEDQLPLEVLLLETPSLEVALWKHHHGSAVVGAIKGPMSKEHR